VQAVNQRLSGQTIVVTGASGIAAAGAELFAAGGAAVFVISRTAATCEALVSGITDAGGNAAWVSTDLTDETATEEAFSRGRDRFGAIHGLFAVAGGSGRRFGDGPIDQMSLQAWRKTRTVNGDPMFLAVREATRAMAAGDGGSIVVVSSVLATDPAPSLFATHGYAAAKGAALSLVRSTAAYYAGANIRVNGLTPALIETPMSARAAKDAATMSYIARKQPLAGGMLPATSVAEAGLFLLSPQARYITGQVIAIDGGWSVTEAGP
jgi:NAD(P)-dependent dehydrogenase (short-subunit alcohol dehydrogenase family)